ncbi:uncharacterized protein KNAG_0C05960 [Huiozyma naganishii CBS 8797]|uniref:Uncharacterized protein n=1 Tax=Huiozyma naganishii (strain ATCC MYA-139 / BCRC 22969 / CBS 8797 / KCTC 17520 / NBRC 10181 / NCYC 3082 / Yp74L-3) TaxID=1071383 RepID=J7S565_HUIN7|nr:hypothetical protein KNAG_0C05960 [Kazachstania naganishii CBS 8797]CCK69694.1 hypothetical protein KNAG_0C05960 [Kazachstania naganishii CBS 8797]
MSGFVRSTLENIGEGILQDKATEFAGTHFQPTRDPFYEKLPSGKRVRRRLPDNLFTKADRRAWKSLQNRAWLHDRSLCGCCCWTETIGWAPLLALLPLVGPVLMYAVHKRLINEADRKFRLDEELKLKMHANIGVDLTISLVPVLGALFAWLHAASTRNAALVYNFVSKRALQQQQQQQQQWRPPSRDDESVPMRGPPPSAPPAARVRSRAPPVHQRPYPL